MAGANCEAFFSGEPSFSLPKPMPRTVLTSLRRQRSNPSRLCCQDRHSQLSLCFVGSVFHFLEVMFLAHFSSPNWQMTDFSFTEKFFYFSHAFSLTLPFSDLPYSCFPSCCQFLFHLFSHIYFFPCVISLSTLE